MKTNLTERITVLMTPEDGQKIFGAAQERGIAANALLYLVVKAATNGLEDFSLVSDGLVKAERYSRASRRGRTRKAALALV